MRRRMLMEVESVQASDEWDVEWDYTMGLPEDFGYTKVTQGTVQISLMDAGLLIESLYSSSYVRYTPTGMETCDEGVWEETVIFHSFSINDGNRVILSNGTNGTQFSLRNGIYWDNSVNVSLPILELETEYIVRVERIAGVSRLYVNGSLICETENTATYYATENRVFFQREMSATLKSLKFKKIS